MKTLIASVLYLAIVAVIVTAPATNASMQFSKASVQELTTTGFAPGVGDVTVEFWMYSEASSSQNPMFTFLDGGTDFVFRHMSDWTTVQLLQARSVGGIIQLTAGSTVPTINTWYYFRVTHDVSASTIEITFWDTSRTKIDTDTATAGSGNRNVTGGLRIGASDDNNNDFYNGRMRNFLIINSVVTDDEESLARAFSSNPLLTGPGNIVFFAPMVDGDDNRAMAQTSITSMTANGSPTTADDLQLLPYRY